MKKKKPGDPTPELGVVLKIIDGDTPPAPGELEAAFDKLAPSESATVIHGLLQSYWHSRRKISQIDARQRERRIKLLGVLASGLLGIEDARAIMETLRTRTHHQRPPVHCDELFLELSKSVQKDARWSSTEVKPDESKIPEFKPASEWPRHLAHLAPDASASKRKK